MPEPLERKGRKLYGYQVQIIKDQLRAETPQETIARDWDISQGMVSHIKSGRHWSDVN